MVVPDSAVRAWQLIISIEMLGSCLSLCLSLSPFGVGDANQFESSLLLWADRMTEYSEWPHVDRNGCWRRSLLQPKVHFNFSAWRYLIKLSCLTLSHPEIWVAEIQLARRLRMDMSIDRLCLSGGGGGGVISCLENRQPHLIITWKRNWRLWLWYWWWWHAFNVSLFWDSRVSVASSLSPIIWGNITRLWTQQH